MKEQPASEYQTLAAEIRDIISDSPNSERTAYHCARLGLLALMYYRGPKTAAMTAYQLADEMADAAQKMWGEDE